MGLIVVTDTVIRVGPGPKSNGITSSTVASGYSSISSNNEESIPLPMAYQRKYTTCVLLQGQSCLCALDDSESDDNEEVASQHESGDDNVDDDEGDSRIRSRKRNRMNFHNYRLCP